MNKREIKARLKANKEEYKEALRIVYSGVESLNSIASDLDELWLDLTHKQDVSFGGDIHDAMRAVEKAASEIEGVLREYEDSLDFNK